MAKRKKVWVLSSGEYSDYRVHCIVEGGKKVAKQLAARANLDSGGRERYVAEWLPRVSADVQKVETLRLQETIWDDGTTESIPPYSRVEWPFDMLYDTIDEVSWRWVRAPMHKDKGGRLEVWGTDHERVRKVFSDRRAALVTDSALRAQREATGHR